MHGILLGVSIQRRTTSVESDSAMILLPNIYSLNAFIIAISFSEVFYPKRYRTLNMNILFKLIKPYDTLAKIDYL